MLEEYLCLLRQVQFPDLGQYQGMIGPGDATGTTDVVVRN